MKSAIVLYGLIAGACAMPYAAHQPQKRDIVWETETKEVIETRWSTKTVWVEPGKATSTAKSKGFEGFEHPKSSHHHKTTTTTHKTHHKVKTHTKTKPKPKSTRTKSTLTITPPPPPTTTPPPAPTSTSTSTPPPPPPPPPSSTPVATPKVAVVPKPKSTYTPPPPAPTSTPSPSPSSSPSPSPSPAAAAPSSNAASSSSGGSGGGSFSGEGTFYTPGMGSCGIVSSDSDAIVAVGIGFMKSSYSGVNPNMNPMCGKKITISYGGKTASATIVDTCAGCAGDDDLDMSPSLFDQFADQSVGRISGVKWSFA